MWRKFGNQYELRKYKKIPVRNGKWQKLNQYLIEKGIRACLVKHQKELVGALFELEEDGNKSCSWIPRNRALPVFFELWKK